MLLGDPDLHPFSLKMSVNSGFLLAEWMKFEESKTTWLPMPFFKKGSKIKKLIPYFTKIQSGSHRCSSRCLYSLLPNNINFKSTIKWISSTQLKFICLISHIQFKERYANNEIRFFKTSCNLDNYFFILCMIFVYIHSNIFLKWYR